MKFASLLAALALPAATSAIDLPNFLRGAGVTVLSDLEGDGIQPRYCDGAPGNPPTNNDGPSFNGPDYDCYKDGYPKCCSKNKGQCPTGQMPACEVDGGNRDGDRCTNNNDCDNDEFCLKDEDECSSNYDGFCDFMPNSCGNNYKPVCACNNREYDNECEANAAGYSVKYFGRC